MSLTSEEKSDAERFDLVESSRQEQLKARASEIGYVSFGPCYIMPEAWRWLRLATRAHSRNPMAKEVTFAVLGQLRSNRFIIKGFVQLTGESGRGYSLFTAEDLKKIEAEGSKKGYILIGILHTHFESTNPSTQDRLAWLTLMFEFNRPLIYFILQPEPLRLAAYSIPSHVFLSLKESIQPIECHVEDPIA